MSIKSLSYQWRGPSFWSPAIGKQGGVAILISQKFNGNVTTWKKDSNGRVLSLLVEFDNVMINLVNVYAPTNRAERNQFYQSVNSFFFPGSKLIIGGDFNGYDNQRDKLGGNISLCTDLSNIKACFNLIDAWRCKHPRVSQYTWFNSDLSIGSRLDSFLVS